MENKKKKTSLYIQENLLKKLKLQALDENKKVNDLILEIIQNYYQK